MGVQRTMTRDEIRTAFTVFYDATPLLSGKDPGEVQVPLTAVRAIFREFPDDEMAANKEINFLIGAALNGCTVEEYRESLESWFQNEFDRLKR